MLIQGDNLEAIKALLVGETILDETGQINKKIRLEHLAAQIRFLEIKTTFSQKDKSPLLGADKDIAYYLLYNGILGYIAIGGGNVLTAKVLESLHNFGSTKVIYGEVTNLNLSKFEAQQIIFKQTPYDIKTS